MLGKKIQYPTHFLPGSPETMKTKTKTIELGLNWMKMWPQCKEKLKVLHEVQRDFGEEHFTEL